MPDMMELIKNGEELAPCYFADNDLIAVGAIKALKESGYRRPPLCSLTTAGFCSPSA